MIIDGYRINTDGPWSQLSQHTHIYMYIYIYLYWVGCIPWFLFRYWNLFWIIDDVVQYLQWLSVEIIQNCSSITCSSEMEITQDYGIPAVLVMDIVQYCGICSVLAMGIPQYCTEPCNNNKKVFLLKNLHFGKYFFILQWFIHLIAAGLSQVIWKEFFGPFHKQFISTNMVFPKISVMSS